MEKSWTISYQTHFGYAYGHGAPTVYVSKE